ncbi:MAG: hypothetical protein A07HN63_01662 [uncultured archaeon A07HN63]|nr:MAG: hypothetical protein A07HN63_01662 [uncultured archaeon A07HN63]
MSVSRTAQVSKTTGESHAPPREQPLEVIETDRGYVLREFRREPDEATVYSVHEDRMKAMAAASDRLEATHHPCILRWDSEDSVGEIYWDDTFDTARVEYSRTLKRWVVVPEHEHYVFASTHDVKQATSTANRCRSSTSSRTSRSARSTARSKRPSSIPSFANRSLTRISNSTAERDGGWTP